MTLSERGADAARIDALLRQLMAELRQVDDLDVLAASADVPEPGARGLDAATMSSLAVLVLGSGGLPALVASVRDWLNRGHVEPRSVRLEIGDDVIELAGASSDEQDRLLSAFLAKHEAAAT